MEIISIHYSRIFGKNQTLYHTFYRHFLLFFSGVSYFLSKSEGSAPLRHGSFEKTNSGNGFNTAHMTGQQGQVNGTHFAVSVDVGGGKDVLPVKNHNAAHVAGQ